MSPVPSSKRSNGQAPAAEPKSWAERAARYHGAEHPSNAGLTAPATDPAAPRPRA